MTNNKQSSVEWYAKQEDELFTSYQKGFLNTARYILLKHRFLEQAKAMHKEEIEKVSEDWWNEGASYMYDGQRKYNSFEQYYNETFGGNND